MKPKTLKLSGIFHMSFGRTYFTGTTKNIHEFLPGTSNWEIFVNGNFHSSITFEGENIIKRKPGQENNQRAFSFVGIYDKVMLDPESDEIVLKLKDE